MEAKKSNERTFHDSWAFYLFLIFAIVLNTIYLYNTSNIIEVTVQLNSKVNLLALIGLNLLFIIICLLVALLLCYLIPKVMVYLSIIVVPVLLILTTYKYIKESPSGNSIGIGVAVISLIFILVACMLVLSHIDYISQVISLASKIFFANFFGILFVFLICELLSLILVFPALIVDSTNEIIVAIRYLSLLLFFWEMLIVSYFLEVYVSSVIFNEVNHDGKNIFTTSFKNSCYALGSISYGALLYAILLVLKAMVQEARDNQRNRDRKPNLLAVILTIIAQFFIDLLGQIVKFANELAFPYLSVNGTPYEESVVKAFEMMTSSKIEKLMSLNGISFVVFTVILSFGIGSYLMNFYFILEKAGAKGSENEAIIRSILMGIATASVFGSVFSLMKSAVLSLIYTCVAIPEKIREYDHDFVNLVENKKKELNSKDQPQSQPQAQTSK